MSSVHVSADQVWFGSADPARLGGRHDDRPRLQPHLPGRQDQGHRGLVREPRHEARHPARLARQHHRARGGRRRSSSVCSRRWPPGAIIGTLGVAFITNHRKAGFFVFRRPDRGLGVPDEPDRGVHRDRLPRRRVAGRSTTRSTSSSHGWCGLDRGGRDRRRRRGRAARRVLAAARTRAVELTRARARSRSGDRAP